MKYKQNRDYKQTLNNKKDNANNMNSSRLKLPKSTAFYVNKLL